MVKAGKIRYAGVSNFTIEQIKKVQAIHPVASVQPPYSMLERGVEAELLPFCAANNIGVVVYSPMQTGMLTGKYTKELIDQLPADDWRKEFNPHFKEPALSANLKLVDGLRPIAKRNGKTVAQLAIAWVLRRAEEAGLVHSTSNTRGDIWYVCNCCTCCCGILRGIAEFGLQHSIAQSAFRMRVDEAACTACGTCLERCRFGALTVEAVACVDAARCIGCGLCASVCPAGALSLERRPAAPEVPEDMEAWRQARAQNRGIDLEAVH